MDRPWIKHYDPKMKDTVICPEKTLYQMFKRTVDHFPDRTALTFEGIHISFKKMLKQVDFAASAFRALGMQEKDVLTICLPNIPQAAIAFYAANKLGIVCNMVHPKTPPSELSDFMTSTESRHIVILDAFMHGSLRIFEENGVKNVIVARIGDYLSPIKRTAFFLAKGRKIPPKPTRDRYKYWKDILAKGSSEKSETDMPNQMGTHDPAVYLHSGGTTGAPKTIVLSSHNMYYLALAGPQIVNIDDPF